MTPTLLQSYTTARIALVRNKVRLGCHADLTARQEAVLLILTTEAGPHTVKDLTARLDTNKPSITRALDALTAAGFAVRKPNPGDRRSVFAEATAEGHAVVRAIHDTLRDPTAPVAGERAAA